MDDAVDPSGPLSDLYGAQGGPRSIFSTKVADYQASRPGYPTAFYEALKVYCPPSKSEWVVDVGSGTGLFSKGLLENGYQVIAVEPNARMRTVSDGQLSGWRGYRSLAGSAEDMDLDDGSAGMITAAQSFHWFQTDAARREFKRVLKPEGLVALVWNDRMITDDVHMALDVLFAKYGGVARGVLVAHEDRSSVAEFFGSAPPYQFAWPHAQELDADGFLSLVFSRSYMPDRESALGAEVAGRVAEVFEKFNFGGKICIRYQTVAMIGRMR